MITPELYIKNGKLRKSLVMLKLGRVSMKWELRFLMIFLAIISMFISGCAGLGNNISAINNLIKLGRNDKLKQKALKQETANFQKVKMLIDNNKIKDGISAKSAIKKFGEPVVVLSTSKGEKWAYKPADADWIGGEKIYLFFNQEDSLVDWECINCKSE